MRIVHVVTKADVGGAQTYVLELATVQAREHQVVIVSGVLGAMADEARGRGIDVRAIGALQREFAGVAEWRAVRELAAIIRELQPDVIHAHSTKGGLVARAIARRRRIPVAYTAHGWPFQPGAPLAQVAVSQIVETALARWWGEVICVTDSEAALARRRRVVPRQRLHVVPNGLPDLPPAERPSGPATPQRPVTLMMVARFSPPKEQDGLLRAMAQVGGDWRLVFVGDGLGLDQAKSVAASLGLRDRVEFLGERRDVAALLGTADIAVLWSRYEGLPLALMEAMRAGVACVANDLPGTRALLADGAGRLVEFSEPALAEALEKLVTDGVSRRSLAGAARARFVSTFSIEANWRGVEQVYAAAGRRARSARRRER